MVVAYKKSYNTRDIIELIKKALPLSVEQTKALAQRLNRGNKEATLKEVFRFLKTIRYEVDAPGTQIVPLPSKILTDNRTDCKGLSILTHGILSNLGIEHAIRFAKYRASETPNEFTHVYVIVPNGNDYITIDAVAQGYNQEFAGMNGQPLDLIFKKEKMKVSKYHPVNKISGIGFTCGRYEPKALCDLRKSISDAYNRSALKETLSEAQNTVKAKTDQFRDWVKEKAVDAQDLAKKFIQPLKTAVGAPVRAAYLALINANLFGWASLFNYGRMTEDEQFAKGLNPVFAATAKGNYNAIRDKWYEWGGNRTQFDDMVKLGATRRPKLDTKGNSSISGIGEAVTFATVVTTALPLITALSGLVLAFKKTPALPPEIPRKDFIEDPDDPGGLKIEEEDNTMLYGGLAAAALAVVYFMTKKK
jgi:hypothetical protein